MTSTFDVTIAPLYLKKPFLRRCRQAERAARLLNAQAVNLDVLDVSLHSTL